MEKKLKTLGGRVLEITPDEANRTYTIFDGVCRYRTNELPLWKFEEMEYYTAWDWVTFLRTSEDYYIVKS